MMEDKIKEIIEKKLYLFKIVSFLSLMFGILVQFIMLFKFNALQFFSRGQVISDFIIYFAGGIVLISLYIFINEGRKIWLLLIYMIFVYIISHLSCWKFLNIYNIFFYLYIYFVIYRFFKNKYLGKIENLFTKIDSEKIFFLVFSFIAVPISIYYTIKSFGIGISYDYLALVEKTYYKIEYMNDSFVFLQNRGAGNNIVVYPKDKVDQFINFKDAICRENQMVDKLFRIHKTKTGKTINK